MRTKATVIANFVVHYQKLVFGFWQSGKCKLRFYETDKKKSTATDVRVRRGLKVVH